jgi:acetyl esterase/lipase
VKDASVDEGVLDPWVAEWLETNPSYRMQDILEAARTSESPWPVTREMARVTDEVVDGVPIRIYEPEGEPTGLMVYFHGGGMCVGSIALMDNVAREIAHASGAVVVSVEYRLAPENPFPAGLDDCEAVTRWALGQTERFGLSPAKVIISGESAGGTFTAAVSLRLRDDADVALAGQVLIYPAVDNGSSTLASRTEFAGLTMTADEMDWCWNAYTGGRDLDQTPSPLRCKLNRWRACRPRSSCSAVATSCATRDGSTPLACVMTASTPRTSATPARSTGS